MVKLKTLDKAGVGDILNGTATPAIAISGNIGRGSGYGFARRGAAGYGESQGVGGIYQRRWTGYNHTGKLPGRECRPYYVKMRTYRPTNPRTVEQQANRSKFQDAVAAWQNMSDAEREPYRRRASKKNRRGRNLFIQEFMLQS